MTTESHAHQIQQHHQEIHRDRRRVLGLWLTLFVACSSLTVAAAISWEVLEKQGLTWVVGLLVVSAGAFLYVIQALHGRSKSLFWPRSLKDAKAALAKPARSKARP